MEKEQQEILFRLSIFEQQMQQLQQQLQEVERGIIEIDFLNKGLDELADGVDKEVYAPIGRGIFAKTKLVSEKLLVDVGDRNLVTKSIPETKKIIENQIKKLEEVKKELSNSMEEVNQQIVEIVMSVRESENKN